MDQYLDQLALISKLRGSNLVNQFVPSKDSQSFLRGGGLPSGSGIPKQAGGGALSNAMYQKRNKSVRQEIDSISSDKKDVQGDEKDQKDEELFEPDLNKSTVSLSGTTSSSRKQGTNSN